MKRALLVLGGCVLMALAGPGLASLVLGASHALLPGHGKTVMGAYLAGRRGSVRDAVLVGATVTATHTAGVLVLGLVVTVTSAVAGEGVMRGLLVAAIGIGPCFRWVPQPSCS